MKPTSRDVLNAADRVIEEQEKQERRQEVRRQLEALLPAIPKDSIAFEIVREKLRRTE